MSGIVISLCDYTGNFVRPWVEAGYTAILVDPQHGQLDYPRPLLSCAGLIRLRAETVLEALPYLSYIIRRERVAFVAAFPPCTDLSVSGARWFETKRQADPMFQAKAVAVAEQCRTIGELSGAPWFVENPVSVLSNVFGPATFSFHPWDYTGFEPADNYTKRTNLWAGGGFVMPPPNRDLSLGGPDDRIHKAAPGDERANFRSATPMGFARAVFAANSPADRASV